MRRRVWTYIGIADVMFSFQVGLRSMINLSELSSNLPRNIEDDDNFHEHIETLPAPHPPSENTSISFMIAKATLVLSFAALLKEMSHSEQVPYERVLEIDKNLRQSYNMIPEHYKLHPLSHTDTTPISLIASRFMLANLHHKSMCVLHSRYLEIARSDTRYLYSRRACLESAVRLLSFQAIQNEQSIAAQSRHNLNRYQTSLTTHDFLLAATIISVELSLGMGKSPFEGRGDAGPTRKELIAALEQSVKIWICLRDRSIEAYKAADVLSMLLNKFRSSDDIRTLGNASANACNRHLCTPGNVEVRNLDNELVWQPNSSAFCPTEQERPRAYTAQFTNATEDYNPEVSSSESYADRDLTSQLEGASYNYPQSTTGSTRHSTSTHNIWTQPDTDPSNYLQRPELALSPGTIAPDWHSQGLVCDISKIG
jgi:hypothetical protein